MKKEEKDLLRLKDILDGIGFEFFLVQGTLLGAVRDGTLIGYDKDFDLGTFEDLGDPSVRFTLEEALTDEGLKCTIRGPERNPRYSKYWALIEGLKWQTALLPCKTNGDTVSMSTSPLRYPAALFAETLDYDFLGTQFLVPYPPEDWLEFNYGPTWRIHAQRVTIMKGSDPIKIFNSSMVEKVYLKCTEEGVPVSPLESIGPQLD